MLYVLSDSASDLIEYLGSCEAEIELSQIVFVPLTIEVYFLLFENKLKYILPHRYFSSADHRLCVMELESLSKKLETQIDMKRSFLKKEIIINTRFNAAYLCYWVKILENISKQNPNCEFKFLGATNFTESEVMVGDNLGRLLHDVVINGNTVVETETPRVSRPFKFIRYSYHYAKLKSLKNFPLFSSLGYNILTTSKFINNCRLFKFFYLYPIKSRIKIKDLAIVTYILFRMRGLPVFQIYSSEKVKDSSFGEEQYDEISKVADVISKMDFLGSNELSKILSIKYHCSRFYYYDLLERYKSYKKLLRELNPSISIAWAARSCQEMISELQNLQGRKSLLISHGTVVPSYDIYDRAYKQFIADSVVISSATHVASQSQMSDAFFAEKNITKIIKTPEIIFNRSDRERVTDFAGSIIYATTLKKIQNIQFLGAEMYDEFLMNIVDLNASLADYDFRVRVHPSFRECFEKNKRSKLIDNIKFSNCSLDNALDSCLLVISLSSTCIESALHRRIPVILYDSFGRYKHFSNCVNLEDEPIRPWPLYYAQSSVSISKHIDFILSCHIDENHWREFIRTYGTYELIELLN